MMETSSASVTWIIGLNTILRFASRLSTRSGLLTYVLIFNVIGYYVHSNSGPSHDPGTYWVIMYIVESSLAGRL